MNLKLSQIRKDPSAQPRLMLNSDHIKDLADSLEDGSDLTPVDVFHDGHSYWLADGFHRHSAYHRAKRSEIPVTVHEGQLRDAVLYSITANTKHAVLKLSRDEKRRSVTRLLRDKEWGQWSDREIGRRAGVSPSTVGATRKELGICPIGQIEDDERDLSQSDGGGATGEIPQSEERKVKRGDSEYTMQVRPKAETPPSSPVMNYRPPITAEQPEEDDRPDYDENGDNDGLELLPPDAEIVNDDEPEEEEPYIPAYLNNPNPPTYPIKPLSNEPKRKEPPFVVVYTTLGKARSLGHRLVIDALNSTENQVSDEGLEAQIDDLIEMLRASKKQAQIERKTLEVA